ncbi:DeoR family transcriptional regulator [Luteolibacter sp. LG18]|nr:DeoR family transcriptional regulator [Luteolibacter sp. LG18]
MLQVNGSVRTVEIASGFGVTDETIRKDFEFLEHRGDLIRIHGGATRPARAREELPLTERQMIRREEKSAIAKLAVARIQPNDTIFLDASSTTLTLTEFLPDMPLTILTNALNVFTALENRSQCDLICTGGLYDRRSRSFIGLPAEAALRRYNIHRMFCSGNGIDLERGISETNSRQASFKERVIANAEEVVYLADHSKLGQKASFFFGDISSLNCVITDQAGDPDFLQALRERGVEVLKP